MTSRPDAPLTFRLATADDVPALGALWADHAGWGGLTPEQWRAWYVDTPYGACPVAVAVDPDGRAVGQLAFTPARVRAAGADVPALRLSAPILRRDQRRRLLDPEHPVIGMYYAVAYEAARQGVGLVYALTDRAWLGFFRWAAREGARLGVPYSAFDTATFGCRARALDAGDAAGDGGIAGDHVGEPLDAFGPETDALWDAAAVAFDARGADDRPSCGVVRRHEWLNFKYGGDFVRLAVRAGRDGALAGYAVVRRADGLLSDVLARDDATYAPVVAATLRALARARRSGATVPPDLRAMDTPARRPTLERLGFVPIDYQFAFACVPLPGGLRAAQVAPARWHVTGGD